MDLAKEFPVLEHLISFNHAAVAPLPARAARALAQFADEAARQGAAVWPQWNRKLTGCRAQAAALLGASIDEIAFVHNTTHGLILVAQSLPWRPGDNVVGLADDFPANVHPWLNLAARGVARRAVSPQPDGRYLLDDFVAMIDARTRVVTVSLVHYASGYRLPIEKLADLCRQRGALLCVDGIQGLGALPVTAQQLGCDFLVADGHKWLLGPEGLGVLYIRKDLIETLETTLTGWVGRERPGDYGDLQQPLVAAARRFEEGSHNMAAAVAWEQSLQLLNEVTLPEVWRQIEEVTAHLEEGARRGGFEVHSPRGDGERSGILRIGKAGVDPEKLVKRLAGRGIYLAARGGAIRFSPHFYNTLEQCDRCLAALDELSAGAAA